MKNTLALVLLVALVVAVAAVAKVCGPMAGAACVLSLFTLPSLLGTARVWGVAYGNKTIANGPTGSFMADPNGSTIAAYTRCKFANPAGATLDGKPILQPADATDRADAVTLQAIAAGAIGTVKFLNSGGETYGRLVAGAAIATAGLDVYAAAAGTVTSSSGGSAKRVGKSTSPGVSGGVLTYAPSAADA